MHYQSILKILNKQKYQDWKISNIEQLKSYRCISLQKQGKVEHWTWLVQLDWLLEHLWCSSEDYGRLLWKLLNLATAHLGLVAIFGCAWEVNYWSDQHLSLLNYWYVSGSEGQRLWQCCQPSMVSGQLQVRDELYFYW